MDRASVSSLFDVVTINRTPNFLYVGRPSTIETKFVKIGVLGSILFCIQNEVKRERPGKKPHNTYTIQELIDLVLELEKLP
jgi:hypothetical protein